MRLDGDHFLQEESAREGAELNRNQVLVVSRSPINRIVISRTVEEIYLKPIAVTPEAALRTLRANDPIMVIVEQIASDDSLKPFMSELALRRAEGGMPRIILVAGSEMHREVPLSEGLFDAIVPKPLTPDTLQPVVERLSKV